MIKKIILFAIVFFITDCFSAQEEQDSTIINNGTTIVVSKGIVTDSLSFTKKRLRSPLKASLYSAILPGLGQMYNKKYIKAPVALALVGTGVGFIKYYDDRYKRYHRAYLAELSGQPHEYNDLEGISPKILANAEDSERRNRDYAIVLTVLVYLLNIVDATVDAHLSIFDTDKDLVIKPVLLESPSLMFQSHKVGISLSLSF